MNGKRYVVMLISLLIACWLSPSKIVFARKGKDRFNIVIIDVTDKDIAKYGRFPWSRDIHAEALVLKNRGGTITESMDLKKRNIAVVLLGGLGLVWILSLFIRR